MTPARIAQNLSVFDFSLAADDIAAIDGLDTGVRGGPNQDEVDFGPSIARSRTDAIACRPEPSTSSRAIPSIPESSERIALT